MASTLRFTSSDLEKFPDDGKRYEIIDGELYVSRQPHYYHQLVCSNVVALLKTWNKSSGLGQVNLAPGVIFAEDDDVAPDVVWTSNARLATILSPDGKLHAAPELVVEVLSPGTANEQRDRYAKLKLYSRRGVREYWIIDWRTRQTEIYRREQAELRMVGTLFEGDTLDTPLLPGFTCSVSELFEDIPSGA
ncbi:MAG: Uma2 family endonuclease [Acidobacteriota bacterium]